MTYIINGPMHEIWVLIAYVQKPPNNFYDDVSSWARCLDLHPYFM